METFFILLAIVLYFAWLFTPSKQVMTEQEKVQREADDFRDALRTKYVAQQREHGKRVAARRSANPYS